MKKIGIIAVSAMLAAGTWGCASAGEYVCDATTNGMHVCETISDPGSDGSALVAACTAMEGTAPSACPTTGALGVCTQVADGVTETLTYYADDGLTAAAAQMQCSQLSGTWKAE